MVVHVVRGGHYIVWCITHVSVTFTIEISRTPVSSEEIYPSQGEMEKDDFMSSEESGEDDTMIVKPSPEGFLNFSISLTKKLVTVRPLKQSDSVILGSLVMKYQIVHNQRWVSLSGPLRRQTNCVILLEFLTYQWTCMKCN